MTSYVFPLIVEEQKMKDNEKSKEQLINELVELRRQVAELETEREQAARFLSAEEALLQSEERLAKINECFLSFGIEPLENINLLTMLCGELLGATCALYNRLDRGMLCSWGQWNSPPDYNPVDTPDGHICYDVIKSAGDEIFVVTNLSETHYAQTDPNVLLYKLQTYVGRAVKLRDTYVGSLCVVYQDDFAPGQADKRVMEIIAAAIGVEEERKRAEESLRKINQAYKALSDCNQALLHATDESELLQEVCRIIKEDCGYHLVWVGFAEQDEAKTVRPVAHAGYEEGYLNTVSITWADTEQGRGPTGTAIRTARPVINRDVLTNPDYAPWRAEAIKRGYASSAALPLIAHEQVLGALNVYAAEPDAFAAQEVDLLMELSGDLAYGIMALRMRAEHARAEEALRESEERAKIILDSVQAGIIVVDSENHIIVEANNAAAEMIGAPRGEIVGNVCHRYVCPEEKGKCPITDLGQTLDNAERVLLTNSGESLPILKTVVPVILGGRKHLLESFIDLTERKRAEHALRESEEKYRRLFKCLVDVFYQTDSAGKITMVSPSITRTTGYRPEEVIGSDLRDFYVYPEERDKFLEIVAKNGFVESYEVQLKKKDGSIFWVSASARLSKDKEGNVVGVEGTARDVTNRKKAEESLRSERERLATVLDGNPIPSFMIDQDHRVVFWNRSMETLASVPREQALGKTLGESFSPAYMDKSPPILADLILDISDEELLRHYGHKIRKARFGEAFEVTTSIWPGGEKRILDAIATRIRDHQGKVMGAFQCAQDITDKKRLQYQLQQAQKMEAIGTLAGGIAHDFNNILGAIISYTELGLLNISTQDPLRYNLGQVLKAADRAKDLVQQILAFSRQSEEVRRPMDVIPVVKEALKLLRATLPVTIEIRQDISTPSGTIMGDPTQVHQILMNLCTNAAHAMRDKGGILTITLEDAVFETDIASWCPELSPGSYLKLTISDTGHGMDGLVLERIFDPYFTTKEAAGGTGLGLAVVHGIVKHYGGSIKVQSELGAGTDFQVFLPKLDVGAIEKVEWLGPIPKGQERILFIDDEAFLVESAEQMLEHLGYDVVLRTSSIKALELFRENPARFDLVITDQTMPNMTGAELAEKILAIRPDTPIILCTGFSEVITEVQAKAIGIREFIMKPIVMREIGEAIRRVLDQAVDD